MKQINWKTFVPALVAAGVLVYESYTSHKVSDAFAKQLSDGILTAVGVIGTLWGFIKNHQKG